MILRDRVRRVQRRPHAAHHCHGGLTVIGGSQSPWTRELFDVVDPALSLESQIITYPPGHIKITAANTYVQRVATPTSVHYIVLSISGTRVGPVHDTVHERSENARVIKSRADETLHDTQHDSRSKADFPPCSDRVSRDPIPLKIRIPCSQRAGLPAPALAYREYVRGTTESRDA